MTAPLNFCRFFKKEVAFSSFAALYILPERKKRIRIKDKR